LARALQYTQWRNFQKVIDRAILACKNSGFDISAHFVDVNKMVKIWSFGALFFLISALANDIFVMFDIIRARHTAPLTF